jgi:hypothetical protein
MTLALLNRTAPEIFPCAGVKSPGINRHRRDEPRCAVRQRDPVTATAIIRVQATRRGLPLKPQPRHELAARPGNTGQARPAATQNEHGRPSARPASAVQHCPCLARYTRGTRQADAGQDGPGGHPRGLPATDVQGIRELARPDAFLPAVSRGDGSLIERVKVWPGKVLVLFFDHGDAAARPRRSRSRADRPVAAADTRWTSWRIPRNRRIFLPQQHLFRGREKKMTPKTRFL